MSSPVCPSCHSDRLHVVGAVVLNPVGVELKTPRNLLKHDETVLSREVVKCSVCNRQSMLHEAEEAASIPKSGALWEQSDYGVQIPIYCLKCGNNEVFTRSVIRQVLEEEFVRLDNGEIIETEVGADSKTMFEVNLSYVCEECGHTIKLRDDNYVLEKS